MNSFMYREKFAKSIPGVKSLHALEIISQISIVSQSRALYGINLDTFEQKFAD